jgi:Phosphomannomutase
MIRKEAFKAYDIRGQMPGEVNEVLAYQVGRAFVSLYQPEKVVVGRDIRLSSQALASALIKGFTDGGCDVVDIGLCGTEQVYHCTAAWGAQGGVMVTASHNPMDYNGLKLVREGAKPISMDTGLLDIYALLEKGLFAEGVEPGKKAGQVTEKDSTFDYVEYLLGLIPDNQMKGLKIVANAGNGCAGPIMDALMEKVPLEFIPMYFEPDGEFPNGIPNPLLPERRDATAKAVIEHQADLGIAWDGDFDRCFFFDSKGRFIDSYYIVGFLSEIFLQQEAGATIIYDPRLVWYIEESVQKAGGRPLESRGGHAFMKETMRKVGALYGGEASGHHFFRDFHNCDSGMLPWLFVVNELCRRGCTLAEVVDQAMARYPVSGEINRRVEDAEKVIQKIEDEYAPDALKVEHLDGLSIEYSEWRFNLRMSNTEPLTRLNLETRGNQKLLEEKVEELLAKIGGLASH